MMGVALVAMACTPKKMRVVAPLGTMGDVLDAARARPTANPVQARFNINVKSKPLGLAFTTGGGLFIDRPGHLYLAVLGPFGGPQLSVASDGAQVGVLVAREKLYMTASDMPALISQTSQGVLEMDDLLALLIGTFPFSEDEIHKTKSETTDSGEEMVRVDLQGPQRTEARMHLDGREATPRSLTVSGDGKTPLLEASWEPYHITEAGRLVPSRLIVEIPQHDLTIDLRFKSWKPLEKVPDVFTVSAPEGYTSISLLEQLEKLSVQASGEAE